MSPQKLIQNHIDLNWMRSFFKTKPNIILFIFIIILGGCEKENSACYLKGVVRHIYTKVPLSGFEVSLEERRSGWNSPSYTFLNKTTTNANGEFTFKIETIHDDGTFGVGVSFPSIFDSTKITCQFGGHVIYVDPNKLNFPHIIELTPLGFISTFASDSTWEKLSVDTIIISSPFETAKLIRGKGRAEFHVDPNQYSTFSWYYLKNGVKGNAISKQIYVPNSVKSNESSGCLFYEIKF